MKINQKDTYYNPSGDMALEFDKSRKCWYVRNVPYLGNLWHIILDDLDDNNAQTLLNNWRGQ